ncbi:MAG: NAD(P)/FAD-dependent oxidoreductase [Magnetococcales bacterium]|nr:NAD(P)/FAD-dependent oxidoreductase [Magnetococcales bacterium]
MEKKRTAIIMGGGPAGLTAALELARRTDIHPIVLEASTQVGGISRTVNFKGNRIDIGGHRFFSKSDRVMDWWGELLPLAELTQADEALLEKRRQAGRNGEPLPESVSSPEDEVMLLRPRVSRILYRQQLFDYPISPNLQTLAKLGLWNSVKIILSFLKARFSQIKPENTLEEFFVNRFGRELYATFFEKYTEKVWGIPCEKIPAKWGAQRVKGLSLTEIFKHAIRSLWRSKELDAQKEGETSLINQFLYPKFGPGQLWEKAARLVTEHGGEVRMQHRVVGITTDQGQVQSVTVESVEKGREEISGELFFSTIPVNELIASLSPPPPKEVRDVAGGLVFRDFLTVGILLKGLTLRGGVNGDNLREKLPDNWIYVQEPDLMVGRFQVYNNWSPFMVRDPNTIWIGTEFFVNVGDELWTLPDEEMAALAIREMGQIGWVDPADVLDTTVIRVPKAYPAYFGTYDQFSEIRKTVDSFENLYLLGRNGLHRYNNMDHSMLTAMVAVDGIAAGRDPRGEIWSVNTETDYHEESGSEE